MSTRGMALFKARHGDITSKHMPGRVRSDTDLITLHSWYRDSQVRHARLYKHKPGTCGMEYEDVAEEDVKLIHKTVQEVTSGQAEFYLQFKPGLEYPIGTYVDIVDEHDHVITWLICHKAADMQLTRYNVFPCNYLFKWVNNNRIYQSLGVLRSINSYSSGRQNKASMVFILDDRDAMWIPTDDVSANFYYDKRVIVSEENRHIPFVFVATKIEELAPRGISKITIQQDKYNPETDYSEKYGYIADINSDVIVDVAVPAAIGNIRATVIDRKGNENDVNNYKIKFGSTIRFSIDGISTLDWSIDGLSAGEYTMETSGTPGTYLIKINRDYDLGGRKVLVSAIDNSGSGAPPAFYEFEVVVT